MIRIVIAAICFCIAGAKLVNGQSYFQTYPKEVLAFEEFYRFNHKVIDSILSQHRLDSRLAISIVAPEIGHYSVWQDKMEISVVALFYVEMGSEYNDFSIGYFQMKPSFVERLEKQIKSMSFQDFYHLLKYSSPDSSMVREERVARMKSVVFQSEYLAAFISICSILYPHWFKDADGIKKLAAAYNVGFWKKEYEIEKWLSIRSFPNRGTGAFSYAKVAQEYFNHGLFSK